MMVACVVGVPLTNNFAAQRCALQPAALAAAPLTIATARIVRKVSRRRACAVVYRLAHLAGSSALLRVSAAAWRAV